MKVVSIHLMNTDYSYIKQNKSMFLRQLEFLPSTLKVAGELVLQKYFTQ